MKIEIDFYENYRFLIETAQCILDGPALMLSGGAGLGFFHGGRGQVISRKWTPARSNPGASAGFKLLQP